MSATKQLYLPPIGSSPTFAGCRTDLNSITQTKFLATSQSCVIRVIAPCLRSDSTCPFAHPSSYFRNTTASLKDLFARMKRHTASPQPRTQSTMSAFTPSLPVPRSSTPHSRSTKSSRIQRRTRPSLSIAPPRERNNIKNRSIIALRGLSDLGGITILHELAARVALPTTLSSFAEADTQLLLGGLIGVWTAAGLAERLRQETICRIKESREIGDRWDAAFVYSPDIVDDEVVDAVGWLHAFEELEGAQASELLNNVARNGSIDMRVGLADALGTVGVASNVVDSVLTGLTNDDEASVRNSAQDALTRYHGIGQRYGMVEEAIGKNAVLDIITERVEAMGYVALSKPDLRQLTGVEEEEGEVIDVKGFDERVEVPLFEGLRLSELHGLCALALIPAGYELLSMADGANLPLRFVGLGWLLTVGGLAAYPQSGMLWRRFTNTIDRSHYEGNQHF